MAIRARAVFTAFVLAGMCSPASGEDVCGIPNINTFLDTCPTNDPAVGKILSDFTIKKNGTPVTFNLSACAEPVSAMPIAQYTDELSLLQTLRVIYYLDRHRCGHLPWTQLSLYDWLRSKVGGFNIDSSATYSSCCGTWPDGRHYVTLTASNDMNREYHRSWKGMAEWIALLMHEARHMDGFPHSTCCAAQEPGASSACDQTYDETNLSPYGIQYWLEKAWVDGTLHTGYTCLPASQMTEIKDWLRGAANSRLTNFCSNPPPVLTDANNPPPPCDQRCAAEVACVAPASGVPPSGGPPLWWSTSPPEPAYHNRLDDPRWKGCLKITYGDGTGEKAEFRALHAQGFLYLSWRALVAPASTPGQNMLYFGYRRAGGGDVIVSVSLNGLGAATASASQLTLAAFLRSPDGTQGAAVTLPPEVPTTARVWVDPAAPGAWAVQLQLPVAAMSQTCGRVQFWYELISGTPTSPVASFTWPRTGADIDGGTESDPHAAVYPDPATWNWLRPSTGPSDSGCATGGVSLDYSDIGTTNTPSSEIRYSSASPFPSNTLFARPANQTGGVIPAGAILATFRLANWGSVPGDWEAGVPVDELWSAIPGGADIPNSGAIPVGATAGATSDCRFNWTVGDPDLAQFLSGARRPHQCILVELRSGAAPGLTFTRSSAHRNMDVVSASRFRRDALLSVKGLAAHPSGYRNLYIYVETQGMPRKVEAGRGSEKSLGSTATVSMRNWGEGNRAQAADSQSGNWYLSPISLLPISRYLSRMSPLTVEAQTNAGPPLPTYRVHVYYDTGRVLSIGGVTRPVLHHQTSFGYQVTHSGGLEGWRHEISGVGLVELAPDWYRVSVPNGGAVTVATMIEAVEPGQWPLWLVLLILVLLVLLAIVEAVRYWLRPGQTG